MSWQRTSFDTSVKKQYEYDEYEEAVTTGESYQVSRNSSAINLSRKGSSTSIHTPKISPSPTSESLLLDAFGIEGEVEVC